MEAGFPNFDFASLVMYCIDAPQRIVCNKIPVQDCSTLFYTQWITLTDVFEIWKGPNVATKQSPVCRGLLLRRPTAAILSSGRGSPPHLAAAAATPVVVAATLAVAVARPTLRHAGIGGRRAARRGRSAACGGRGGGRGGRKDAAAAADTRGRHGGRAGRGAGSLLVPLSQKKDWVLSIDQITIKTPKS